MCLNSKILGFWGFFFNDYETIFPMKISVVEIKLRKLKKQNKTLL